MAILMLHQHFLPHTQGAMCVFVTSALHMNWKILVCSFLRKRTRDSQMTEKVNDQTRIILRPVGVIMHVGQTRCWQVNIAPLETDSITLWCISMKILI